MLKEFVLHFVRRFCDLVYSIIYLLVCLVIFIVTLEPLKIGKVTKRKFRRIKRCTAFKLWLWRNMEGFLTFIEEDEHYRRLEKEFGYGL